MASRDHYFNAAGWKTSHFRRTSPAFDFNLLSHRGCRPIGADLEPGVIGSGRR